MIAGKGCSRIQQTQTTRFTKSAIEHEKFYTRLLNWAKRVGEKNKNRNLKREKSLG